MKYFFPARPLLILAACTLAGSIALAQDPAPQPPPAPPAPTAPTDNAQPPAPIERHTTPRRMAPGGPGPMMREHIERFHDMHEGGMGPFAIGPGGMWWKRPEVVQRLNLTPDQV